MAVTYGDYYTLETTSYNGNHFKIVISKKNYTGTPKIGVLGATPQLVRDKNDRICGTSLEIPIQCNVDGELYEFYTSDISLYRVAMYENDSLVFSGSLLPELYSEPNVAPPFDVILTAVDGLGELKRAEYAGMNYASINMTIEQLLSYTGVELPVRYFSALRCDEVIQPHDNDQYRYAYSRVGLDIRHLDGESCYEVLQQLLETLNAYICQYNGKWMIYSEPYIHKIFDGWEETLIRKPDGRPDGKMPAITIGSVNKSLWWPIEHMNLSVVPARKAIKLKADDNYRESILEDYNFENGDPKAWSLGTFPRVKLNGHTVIETWGGHTMYQNVEFLRLMREKLKIRTIVSFSKESTASYAPAQWHIAITAYDASGKNYEFWNEHGTAKDIIYCEHPGGADYTPQLSAPGSAGKVPYKWEQTIDLNTLPEGVTVKSMRIGIYMQYAYQGYRYYVHECALYPDDSTVTKGYKLEGALNNGARDSISAASLIPLHDDEYRVWDGDAMYGVPYLYDQWSGSWKDRIKRLLKFSLQYDAQDEYDPAEPQVAYCEALVKDLARNYGLPRVRMQGVLNVPSSINNPDFIGMPLVFCDGDVYFTPESVHWRVAEDEMDVELISAPTAEVTVANITKTVEY